MREHPSSHLFMSYLRYLYLFNTYCVVVLFCFSSFCLPYVASFSGFPYLIAPSVFSNVYETQNNVTTNVLLFNISENVVKPTYVSHKTISISM